MQLLECDNYKDFLKWKIKNDGKRSGYKGEMASYAGCQQSYLSRVINGSDHFTPEHAMGMAEFWGLSELETEYFLELVSLARAGKLELRDLIFKRLKKMRTQSKNLSQRFNKKDTLSLDHQNVYYSSWHYSAIHIALTVPSLRTVQRIAQGLGLDIQFVKDALFKLKEMGLVEKSGEQWMPGKQNVHLSNDSPLLFNHLLNWRMKASINSQTKRESNLHYTAVHSLSREDFSAIQALLLAALDKTRTIVDPSKEEVLVGLNVDWFRFS